MCIYMRPVKCFWAQPHILPLSDNRTHIVQAKRRCQRHIRQMAVGIKVEAQFSQATRKAWVGVSTSNLTEMSSEICCNLAPLCDLPKIEQILERDDHTCASPNSPLIQPSLFWTMFQMVFFHFFFALPMNALPILMIVGYYQLKFARHHIPIASPRYWWIKELLLLNLFGDTTANYPIISLLTHPGPSSRIQDTCYKSTLQEQLGRLSNFWNLTLPCWSCTWDCSMCYCPSTKEQSPLSLKVSLSLKWSTTWSGEAFQQAAQISAKSLKSFEINFSLRNPLASEKLVT